MATKVAPSPEGMVRDLKPQPRTQDNGCCLKCCGKAAGPVDVKKILADGGKFVQTADGRIVEYFLYGHEGPADVPVFLAINGTAGTGWLMANLPMVDAALKEKGIRGLAITLPGYGYTSLFPATGYGLGKWPGMDVEPVLAAEGLTGPLMVEGTSYGAGLALSAAHHFGSRVSHLHLHVPYIPAELRVEVGIPEKLGDDGCFDRDTAWANSCACPALCFHCCCFTAGNCITPCCPSALDDETTKLTEAVAVGSTKSTHYDVARAYRRGSNSHGIVHNMIGSVISKNWGFDVRAIDASTTKVMVSYNLNDHQVGAKELLPENPHGKWLADHFTAKAAKCVVNEGGSREAKANQHGAQMPKLSTGEFVRQLASL